MLQAKCFAALIFVIHLLLVKAAGQSTSTAYVSQGASSPGTMSLLAALQNATIETIVLVDDYTIGPELDGLAEPLPISRNITLTSSAGNNWWLDQSYRRGKLQLCSTCTFTVANLTLTNDRKGKGILSFWSLNDLFFAPIHGASIVYRNVYMVRQGCTTSNDTRQIVSITKRADAFPATHFSEEMEARERQQGDAFNLEEERREQHFTIRNETIRGVLYPDSIHAVDYSVEAPLVQEDGATLGGYAMHLLNSSRACLNTVSTSCQLSPDACVNQLVDEAQRAEAEAAQQAKARRAIAIAVPITTAAALVAAAACLLWRQKQRRQTDSSSKTAPPWVAPDSATATAMEAGVLQEHFASESSGGMVHRPFGLHKGWAVSHSQTTPHLGAVENDKILFGELIGSGSFGRVYHGHWAGRQVAIKVIQHTTENAEAVRNEVELMMLFNHPNIVRAYHYVTYIRDPALTNCNTSFTSKAASLGSRWDSTGNHTCDTAATAKPAHSAGRDDPARECNELDQESDYRSTGGSLHSSAGSGAGSRWDRGRECSSSPGAAAAATAGMPTGRGAPKKVETWLVEEFCDAGTLGTVASEWEPENEGDEQMLQRLLLLQDCARGLQALHDRQVVHGDLNARNVLVSSNPVAQFGHQAKLADLGLSRIIAQSHTHHSTNSMGTMSHMPPELLRSGLLTPAVDVYSFGIMMWELYTGQPAFRKLHYGQFFEAICLQNLRPLVPANMPADYKLLMERCWSTDPADRPPVGRILHSLCIMIDARAASLAEDVHLGPIRDSMAAPLAAAAAAATAALGTKYARVSDGSWSGSNSSSSDGDEAEAADHHQQQQQQEPCTGGT